MTLRELNIGQSAVITSVGGEGALRQHFLDMGIIPGSVVTLRKYAPMGDPMQLLVIPSAGLQPEKALEMQGYELTLRLADAEEIGINPVQKPDDDEKKKPASAVDANAFKHVHPGFGEPGIYHDPTHERPLPEDELLTFALVGNQNCGKTTLFNQLTGANQHVGNFPGVTVDRKSGKIRGYRNTDVTDLPGIYSLSPYTNEEVVSRDFILNERPKCIINIVDANNIERNLYLTMQLLELGIPMVLAINMMDELEGNGGGIDINVMESMLGIPVVPVSAAKNQGISELIEHAVHVARYQEGPAIQDFCPKEDHGGAVHRCLHAIMHLIEDHAKNKQIPIRFAAARLVEGDNLIAAALQLSSNERETIEHILCQLEEERGLDRAAALADMRFSFIARLCSLSVKHPKESREHRRSERIDSLLTGKYAAIPTFLGIMVAIFWLTFDVIGGTLQGLLEEGIARFMQASDEAMVSWEVDDTVRSLIIDGIYAGVGSVASFVPIIVTLFFFLSMLEDSGYMARIAFVMDRPLRRIGLSGRSIVPLLIGFGCSVPAVMSSRTLPSLRDRRLTVLLTPFMSCTAKLPIYAFFCAVFFPENAALVMTGLYILGIVSGIIVALLLKHTTFRGEAVPFVMELPNYRMPSLRSTMLLLWEKTSDFLQRAFTVIFMATILIWFLQSFSFHLHLVDNPDESILGIIADFIAPVFSPVGFGDWRVCTSLISGFLAKESVVSTLSVLYGDMTAISTALSAASAASLLVFCLIYTPCVAAIASIKRELGMRYALYVVIGQCVIAYLLALLAYNIF